MVIWCIWDFTINLRLKLTLLIINLKSNFKSKRTLIKPSQLELKKLLLNQSHKTTDLPTWWKRILTLKSTDFQKIIWSDIHTWKSNFLKKKKKKNKNFKKNSELTRKIQKKLEKLKKTKKDLSKNEIHSFFT